MHLKCQEIPSAGASLHCKTILLRKLVLQLCARAEIADQQLSPTGATQLAVHGTTDGKYLSTYVSRLNISRG